MNWEQRRDKPVLVKTNIMHRDSDARDYVTHSKSGRPIVELVGTTNMGNGGVAEKV